MMRLARRTRPTPERIAEAEAKARRRLEVAALLRSYRQAAKVIQRVWAETIPVTLPAYNAVERGERMLPRRWLEVLPLTDEQRARLVKEMGR